MTWPELSRTLNFNDWYKAVIVHEFTHLAHLNYRSGFPEMFHTLTGLPLFDAQFRSPFVESTTLFSESNIRNGGRLNNPLMKSLVNSISFSKDFNLPRISAPPLEDFMYGTVYYVAPAFFYKNLVDVYGIETVKSFLKDFSGKTLGLGIEGSSKKVFGKSLSKLFYEWTKKMRNTRETKKYKREYFVKYNTYIADIAKDNEKLYFVYRRYGKDSIYGWKGYVLAKIEDDGRVKDIKKIRGFAGNLVVKSGKAFYMIYLLDEDSKPFPKYKRAIVELDLNTGKDRLLVKGMISAFAVKEKSILYSVYDPKKDLSFIFDMESQKVIKKLKGFIREMDFHSGKLAVLLSNGKNSSVLKIFSNGKGHILNDRRFKYSLSFCGDNLCFLAFDGGFADLFSYDGKKIIRLSEKEYFYDAVKSGNSITAVVFSDKHAGMKIVECEAIKNLDVKLEEEESETNKNIPNYPVKDADGFIISKTLTPIFHVPLVFPINNVWYFSFLLGGYSPDYSFIWASAPFTTLNGDFGIFGGLNISAGNFSLLFYALPLSRNLEVSYKLLNGWLSSDSSYILKANLSTDFNDWIVFLDLIFNKGELFTDLSVGYGAKGVYSKIGFDYQAGSYVLNGNVKYYEKVSVNSSLHFPIAFTNIGIMDPYFHLSHIYGSIGGGYDDSFYLKIGVGAEFSEFLSYSRNFLQVFVKIYLDKWKIGLNTGF